MSPFSLMHIRRCGVSRTQDIFIIRADHVMFFIADDNPRAALVQQFINKGIIIYNFLPSDLVLLNF